MNLSVNGKYRLIYADPPWKYKQFKTGRDYKHGAAQKYTVLSVEEICSLDVPRICEANCALFLWVTVPLLDEGFKVLQAWGFKYKTAIFWRKVMSLGLGYWFRGQVEVCMFGTHGNMKAFRSQKPNFIQSKAREHSRKPDQMYSLLESLGLEPKIELFARHRRVNWDCWGNDIKEDAVFQIHQWC